MNSDNNYKESMKIYIYSISYMYRVVGSDQNKHALRVAAASGVFF